MIRSPAWRFVSLASACALAGSGFAGDPQAADSGCTMRVESDLFADGASEPVARSLTLFENGVAWDFLELPPREGAAAAEQPALQLAEIVLHDPARQRVVVIDPRRDLKTQVETVRLERLSVSLARWARTADDRLVRWAGGPDFDAGLTENEASLELVGPRVRYAVAYEAAPSPEAAGAYREFADTAILLRALLHPGGIPPFPRLALNRRLEAAGAIPAEVTLEIDRGLAILPGASRMRCVHRVHPRLLAADGKRIAEAQAHVAAATAVDVAAFVARRGE
ncbi:MAG: hypothetical protein ACK6CT_11890 [Planctomycetia bacterium]|jgi:hypothetical protein